MKDMKAKYMIVALATMLLASCSFLDIDTENKIASEAVDYSNTSEMYKPVIGAYSQLRTSGMHWANNMLWIGRDDDMTSGRDDDQGDALLFGYRGGYQQPNSFWAVNNAWVTPYEIIRTCNSALEALDQYAGYLAEGSADYKTYLSYQGEVLTIRAWAYYMLATTFGHCVILEDNSQSLFVRSKVEKVIEYASADLEKAAANMQRVRPNQMTYPGALTAFTAEALLARFCLLTGDYTRVENLTQDIIDNGGFSLYPDYYNLFKIPGKLCDESLMEVQVTDFGLPDDADYIGIDQWFNCQGANISLKNAEGTKDSINIAGWTFMRFNPNFVTWAQGRGETVRLETSCMIGGETTREGWVINGNVINNGKAYLPQNQMTGNATTWGRNNNVRLIRYAEVLLMNAEAKVRNGKSGDEPLRLVRERAGLSGISGATVDNILDERRMELCAEWGLRYTDLVRTGKAAEVLNSDLCPRDEKKSGLWTEEKKYWPVPGTQIIELPTLNEDPK